MPKSRGIRPPRQWWLADEEQYLREPLAAHEKEAQDHRDTLSAYAGSDKPGHRTRWLSHVARAAQADWYAEDVRDKLRALGVSVPALIPHHHDTKAPA